MTSTIINQILIIMKKVLFIIAVLSVTFAANAQSVQFYSTFDTLSTVQLRQEIVNLNNGVADFRNDYLIGVGLQVGGSVLAGLATLAKEPSVGTAVLVAGSIAAMAGTIMQIVGVSKLTKNKLQVDKNGIVYKFN